MTLLCPGRPARAGSNTVQLCGEYENRHRSGVVIVTVRVGITAWGTRAPVITLTAAIERIAAWDDAARAVLGRISDRYRASSDFD
ncbi:MAG: hypothetical protein ACRDTC_11600 [Pseudonocardiaceae bacterium]